MMRMEEAIDILNNRKRPWSHEIQDAEQTCIEAIKILVKSPSPVFEIVRKYINTILERRG